MVLKHRKKITIYGKENLIFFPYLEDFHTCIPLFFFVLDFL